MFWSWDSHPFLPVNVRTVGSSAFVRRRVLGVPQSSWTLILRPSYTIHFCGSEVFRLELSHAAAALGLQFAIGPL